MSKRNNIFNIDGGGKPNAFVDAVMEFKRNLESQIEYYQMVARLKKAYFDSLKKEGFTEAEALEIIKSMNY